MRFIKQVWVLTRKDLNIVVRKRWISTTARALILPIVLIVILTGLRSWTATPGFYGVGTPTPVISFDQSLRDTGKTRPDIVIVNPFNGGDIGNVVEQLSTTIRDNGKHLHIIKDPNQIQQICVSNSRGVSNCYGAVQFHASPNHGPPGTVWNYTMYGDGSLGNEVDVRSNSNDVQQYSFPFKQGIDSAIANVSDSQPTTTTILNYPFTQMTEEDKQETDLNVYMGNVESFIAFAFFVSQAGLTYHCVGWITSQREKGLLQLIDAMMPNSRIECIISRMIGTHTAFDIVYFPSWILMGVIMGTLGFPNTPIGYLILLNIMCGLALTSYSILVSSLFNKTQLSAISAIVAALVFAAVAQFAENDAVIRASTTGVLATATLFPPSTYVYFLMIAANYESQGLPFQINVPSPNITSWSVSTSTLLGLFVFQILVYPWIGVLIEHLLHGTSSRSRIVSDGSDMGNNAVILKGFSKSFKPRTGKGQVVKAVDNLDLQLRDGSITVLLGANGSGKTTTLNAIAGLETITTGQIQVNNTGGLGICPQKNVMWDEMTVREHISFFDAIKDTTSKARQYRKLETERLIVGCDLSIKSSARSKTLSGGQKRKLQLAMMLAGGSKVCCIDEASSGIDPLARRKIWDILLTERGTRSILMTTHFLDEAEVLSDHTLILSKGSLKAEGPVAALKSSMGGGYRVSVPNDPRLSNLPHLPNVTSSEDFNRIIYEVPNASILASFVNNLDQQIITNYQIQGPTIENVFLKLAHETQNSDLAVVKEDERSESASGSGFSTSEVKNSTILNLNTGKGCSPFKQCGILFLKRLTILKHNYMPYVAALFVSLTLAGVVTLFFSQLSGGVQCAGSNQQHTSEYQDSLDQDTFGYQYSVVYGGAPINRLRNVLPPSQNNYEYPPGYQGPDLDNISTVSSLSAFHNFFSSNSTMISNGGLYFDSQNSSTFAWGSPSQTLPYSVFFQSALNGLTQNQTIAMSYSSFSQAYFPSSGTAIMVAVFTVLGFSLYPGFFALYPTAERLRNVRAMHYSNGIYSSSLWIAYALFDMMFVLLISALTIAIWISNWNGWYGLGYMFLVFSLYGLTSTAYAYVVSLFVPSQLAALAAISVIQVIIAMLYFVGYITTVTNAPSTDIYAWFNYMHYTLALISPAVSLLRALFVCLNVYALACQGPVLASYPASMDRYGAPILYLIIQFLLLAAFLMYWESGRSLEVFGIHRKQKSRNISDPEKNTAQQDIDAIEETERLAETNTGLRVHNISKTFGKTLAVDNVSLGVLPSEKFALLGVNGAGKTTLLGCIRGDLRPDHQIGIDSDVIISKDSLKQVPVAAKNHLGVCPQFDAVDTMTLREHLVFYARARGVPDKENNIKELITRLGLTEHQNKLVRKLSGGTKRKLSLAIALISNPHVLLLDEPSSGMDAAAKRALWNTLSAIVTGRVLLITTHSMEEADALCDRAAIMAGRLLALGSIDNLRKKHGNSVSMHLVHKDAPHTREQDSERMKQWVLQAFPGVLMDRRDFGGQLRLSLPRGQNDLNTDMARLFKIIERVKDDLGISDYSIGPSTLDQVFLNVVYKHNVQEENTAKKGGINKILSKNS